MWHQPEMCNGQTFYFYCNVLFWYFPYWSSSWTSVYRPKPSVCIPICSSDRTDINYQSKIVEQLGKYNRIFIIVLAALSCILRQQNRTDCVVSVLEQHSVTDCVQTCNIRWSEQRNSWIVLKYLKGGQTGVLTDSDSSILAASGRFQNQYQIWTDCSW